MQDEWGICADEIPGRESKGEPEVPTDDVFGTAVELMDWTAGERDATSKTWTPKRQSVNQERAANKTKRRVLPWLCVAAVSIERIYQSITGV